MYELNVGIYEVVTSVKYELLLNDKYTNNTLIDTGLSYYYLSKQ